MDDFIDDDVVQATTTEWTRN